MLKRKYNNSIHDRVIHEIQVLGKNVSSNSRHWGNNIEAKKLALHASNSGTVQGMIPCTVYCPLNTTNSDP